MQVAMFAVAVRMWRCGVRDASPGINRTLADYALERSRTIDSLFNEVQSEKNQQLNIRPIDKTIPSSLNVRSYPRLP